MSISLTYNVNLFTLIYMGKNTDREDIMEIDLTRLCEDYLEAIEVIRKGRLMSVTDVIRELDVSYITLKRIKANPSTCSLITLRKLKRFVDSFDEDN
jgi:ribosome-binding protein aMBF1 (putative translation factor)